MRSRCDRERACPGGLGKNPDLQTMSREPRHSPEAPQLGHNLATTWPRFHQAYELPFFPVPTVPVPQYFRHMFHLSWNCTYSWTSCCCYSLAARFRSNGAEKVMEVR